MDKSKIYTNSKDEGYTPKEIIDFFNEVTGGFTLDPATTNEQAKKLGFKKFYTKETNGLNQSGEREIVGLNPPFSNKDEGIKKARYEVENNGAIVFILLPLAPETKIGHKSILNNSIIGIPNKRIKFLSNDIVSKSAPFTSAIVELKPYPISEYKTFNIN